MLVSDTDVVEGFSAPFEADWPTEYGVVRTSEAHVEVFPRDDQRNRVEGLTKLTDDTTTHLKNLARTSGKRLTLVQHDRGTWRPVLVAEPDGRITQVYAPTHISTTRRVRRLAAKQARQRKRAEARAKKLKPAATLQLPDDSIAEIDTTNFPKRGGES